MSREKDLVELALEKKIAEVHFELEKLEKMLLDYRKGGLTKGLSVTGSLADALLHLLDVRGGCDLKTLSLGLFGNSGSKDRNRTSSAITHLVRKGLVKRLDRGYYCLNRGEK